MSRDLDHYAEAVRHPRVSAFEHIETLEIRDRLAADEPALSQEDRERLRDSDAMLLRQADQFAVALARVTSLAHERARRQPSAKQWWWYLDVLSEVAGVAAATGGR